MLVASTRMYNVAPGAVAAWRLVLEWVGGFEIVEHGHLSPRLVTLKIGTFIEASGGVTSKIVFVHLTEETVSGGCFAICADVKTTPSGAVLFVAALTAFGNKRQSILD